MSAGRNPTLIEQLFDTGRLKSPSFSLYLDPKWRSDKGFVGELTFGGMDSIRYIKPMEYALAAGEDRWKVQLDTITVGDSRLKVFGDVAFVDTGTNYLFVPAKHWEALTSAIWQGPDVKLTYFPKLDALFVSCRERSKLPDIALGIRGLKKTVYLSLSQEAYVAADLNGKCYLQFYRSPTEYWIFPDFVLVGNFLHFLPSGLSGHPSPVIGIAKLRSLPEPRLKGGALSV
ncbi:Napsin-A precursor, putative [Perkinsus marinus ATCC 50983]|uniref:Napsin-A, putative n=1 Tax=Perkinsus marinus (strain ATCC 50983 / TXsc) TaxID=423536 RepID=C5L0H0_PERM5|nr:Napsin-A precursor, putative [Perkinsus marinus ATCC 50983]EER09793.1 Napsin-A precursor, putative [Perkinsus marinus ATCC 50983]|eukprot:XP_002777998.1 Napsin-A precursor, putative [Perkinsus marinus ATCC 50983]